MKYTSTKLKRDLPLLVFIITLLLLLGGCSSVQQVLRVTQDIEGNGNATIQTPLGSTSATVQNARQEDGKYRADRIDVVHTGRWSGTRIELHFEDYGRSLIED